MAEWDVVIIGAGPAGSSAAISLARSTLNILLIESAEFPRHRPGESLHPGVESLFEKLGVHETVNDAGFIRHRGVHTRWNLNKYEHFEAFGTDVRGEWFGYQALRPKLDSILLERAMACGVTVWQSSQIHAPIVDSERVVGLQTDRGKIGAHVLLDATGRSAWLTRKLDVSWSFHSKKLIARYGYVYVDRQKEVTMWSEPHMLRDTKGWTWIAHIQENRYAWVRMTFDGVDPGQDFIPPELGSAKPDGPSRGADVTWRIADQLAGQGWFLLGDAAVVLDPASSHGVVRALMSGMQAANLIAACKDAQISNSKAANFYGQWMRKWFDHDVEHLLRHYNYSS